MNFFQNLMQAIRNRTGSVTILVRVSSFRRTGMVARHSDQRPERYPVSVEREH